MIKYKCASCGGKLETDDSLSGKQEPCPVCGKTNPVPLSPRDLAEHKRQRKEAGRQQQKADAERLRGPKKLARQQEEVESLGNPMDEIIMKVKGVNGQIELLPDRVRIRRGGVLAFLTQGLKGDKDILISHISSIQFRGAGLFANGYIQFAFMGGQEAKGGLLQGVHDENTIVFTAGKQNAFAAIKRSIEERMSNTNSAQRPSLDLDDLERLAILRDKGIITDEEFKAKKRQLLDL